MMVMDVNLSRSLLFTARQEGEGEKERERERERYCEDRMILECPMLFFLKKDNESAQGSVLLQVSEPRV